MKRYLGAAAFLLLAGCLSTGPTTITLTFDMNVVGEDWLPRAADMPLDRLGDVNLVSELRNLPAPLNTTRRALYLAGTNVTGDMFVFLQKKFLGLEPNASFRANIAVQYATDIHSGCLTGAGPGTFIKAGVTELELLTATDNQGVLRVDLNVGNHSDGGDFTRLGDIRNGLAGCPAPGTFAIRTTPSITQPLTLVTGPDGGIILFVGLDSNVLARSEIYIVAILVGLVPN